MNEHTHNMPWSDRYAHAGKEWAQLEGAARMLEETKTAVLAQRKAALGDMADNKAEKAVKASVEWHEFITKMVEARTAANLAKVKLKYFEMKFYEGQFNRRKPPRRDEADSMKDAAELILFLVGLGLLCAVMYPKETGQWAASIQAAYHEGLEAKP